MGFHTVQGDTFTSVTRMKELYRREGRLLDSLLASIKYYEHKLDLLTQHHSKIRALRATEEVDMEKYLGHPVNGFSLIKRQSRDWPFIMNIMADNYKMTPSLVDKVRNFREDTERAIRGLTRLQKVYDLDTDQLADGWVGGTRSLSVLTAADCMDMAQYLSKRNEFVLATSWLRTAQRRVEQENDTSVSQQQLVSQLYLYSTLAMCEQQDFYSIFPRLPHTHDTSYTPDAGTAKLYRLTLEQNCSWYDWTLKKDKIDMGDYEDQQFNQMCRGEPKGPSGLKCRYIHYHRPDLLLAPFKLEEVSINPPIVMVHHAISETEIQELREASLSKLSECTTNVEGEEFENNYRKCEKSWIGDYATPASMRVRRRVGQLSNLVMDCSEYHQIAGYGLGGEFKLHFDPLINVQLVNIQCTAGTRFPMSCAPTEEKLKTFVWLKCEMSAEDDYGCRLATVMFYLNDVTKGGYTVFPLLNVAVAPVKGSALLWFNILHDSTRNTRMFHGGCPVLLGSKWVMNTWIYEGGQDFESYHCPIDEKFPKEYFYI